MSDRTALQEVWKILRQHEEGFLSDAEAIDKIILAVAAQPIGDEE